uniref:Uncharacterized protein n=1 Tax=Arundo donax TaxID=35708 RepID=A0A0A9HL80_ARUDO
MFSSQTLPLQGETTYYFHAMTIPQIHLFRKYSLVN